MRERRWLLLVVYGLLLAVAVSGALKATRPKFKIATTSTTTTEGPKDADDEDGDAETTTASDVNATTSRVLTGIPQIDYIWDPNLPRELNGYNLSEYPFYNSIPEEIDFKCDGLHDGFYASVIHKCQVYHHCLYGTRYDFLCANFTAFDQRTFICHFASEVDCANSKKYWHRNDALYKAAETTTIATTTTSTTTTTTLPPAPGLRPGGRRRRPYRRRPAYDYYEEEYYDDEAYERTRPRGYDRRDDYDYDDRKYTRRDRDRDRNFRDRDYRDRETPRTRDADRPLRESERPVKDEPPLSPRERFPSRNNRRDPVRTAATLPKDPILEEEPRNRNRDQDPPIRAREPEESPVDDRIPLDSRNTEVDDRRYSDKGYADDYEDEPIPPGPASSSGTSDVLVKPAAPASSVYARPRAPPKIRRPVPITEQDKFAYKATSAPPIAAVEARRRPVEIPPEDDYYEDELEEVRPRRPTTRRRPGFRDFYENPRERDRDRPFRTRYREDGDDLRSRKYPERNRDRYYERGLDRGRDRSLDRSKDRGNERIPESMRDRQGGRLQESDRTNAGRPVERDHDIERPKSSPRQKEFPEILPTTKRPNVYERTSVAPSTTSTVAVESFKDEVSSHNSPNQPLRNVHRQDKQSPAGRNTSIKSELQLSHQSKNGNVRDQGDDEYLTETERNDETRFESQSRDEVPTKKADKPGNEAEEHSSVDEDYDEHEYQPTLPPTPRTAVRIVKRPFLPSRGGNPNPRGLSPVGSKATGSSRKEEAPANHSPPAKPTQRHSEGYEVSEREEDTDKSNEGVNTSNRQNYDAYKSIQKDFAQNTRSDEYEQVLSKPATRRPANNDRGEDEQRSAINHSATESNRDETPSTRISSNNGDNPRGATSRNAGATHGKYFNNEEVSDVREKSAFKWNNEEYRMEQPEDVRREPQKTQPENTGLQIRPESRLTENSGYYDSSYADENNERNRQPILSSGNIAASKPTLNEVVTHHRLQDIPESEYDVALNEALTPSFSNQETNLPSGFVLPIHRQLAREPILQSTENSYKVSRPYNPRVTSTHSQPQYQQQQQQQQKPFLPSQQYLSLAGIGNDDNDDRSRSVQYFRTPEAVHVTGPQYRHQRGSWHDYTGY